VPNWKSNSTTQQRANKPVQVADITFNEEDRLLTPDNEFNRVLGGGIVAGSLVLIGGEPGIGKSTLMLQLALNMPNLKVLYVSGEESERQIKMRAERMEAQPRLGTTSGKPWFVHPRSGELVPEVCGDEMSVGMTKFYRVTCFQEIGGFVRQVMWDGIDCHRCRMLGWLACSWDDPELRFIHLRPMGSSQVSIVTGRKRHGFGQYFMGTSLPYMTVSAVYRATKAPYFIGGAAMWWGFVESMLQGKARFDDPEFRRFLRHYQWECMLLGKAKATARANERQKGQWMRRAVAAAGEARAGSAAEAAR